jgi:hypothetical protein
MVVSVVSSSRNVTGFMKYVRDDKAHSEGRDRFIGYETQNVMLSTAEKSMFASLKRHGKTKNVHGTAVMVSFDKSELSSENPDDIDKACRISMNVCRKMVMDNEYNRLENVSDEAKRLEMAWAEADKYKIVSVAQDDGKGGNLHVHSYILNINPETGRSLDGTSRRHNFVKNALSEEMARENVQEFDFSKKVKDKATKWEKERREKGQYVWRDDLKNRIKDALNSPESVSDETFILELGKRGVDTRKRGKGYSFGFHDEDGKKRSARGGKLGSDFELTSIQAMFAMNAQKQREREEKERDERERERIKADVKRGKQVEAPKPDGLAGMRSLSIDDLNLSDVSLTRRPPERSENARIGRVGVSEDKSMPEKKEGLKIEKRASESVVRENDVKSQNERVRPSVPDREIRREESFTDRLLNYAKTEAFRMFSTEGHKLVSTEPMTFYDRMCQGFKKTIDDAQLLNLARKFEFRPAVFNSHKDKYEAAERLIDSNGVVVKDPNITLETHFKKVEAEKGRNVGQENLRAFESYEKSVGNKDVSEDYGLEV